MFFSGLLLNLEVGVGLSGIKHVTEILYLQSFVWLHDKGSEKSGTKLKVPKGNASGVQG